MVLALHTEHSEEVEVSRSCCHDTVNCCVSLEKVVGEERVLHTDVTMLI